MIEKHRHLWSELDSKKHRVVKNHKKSDKVSTMKLFLVFATKFFWRWTKYCQANLIVQIKRYEFWKKTHSQYCDSDTVKSVCTDDEKLECVETADMLHQQQKEKFPIFLYSRHEKAGVICSGKRSLRLLPSLGDRSQNFNSIEQNADTVHWCFLDLACFHIIYEELEDLYRAERTGKNLKT